MYWIKRNLWLRSGRQTMTHFTFWLVTGSMSSILFQWKEKRISGVILTQTTRLTQRLLRKTFVGWRCFLKVSNLLLVQKKQLFANQSCCISKSFQWWIGRGGKLFKFISPTIYPRNPQFSLPMMLRYFWYGQTDPLQPGEKIDMDLVNRWQCIRLRLR